jgi:2-polyprenyl-6-methoxyphenol hydroxylase-like FAD-dependent oxidoreductase
MSTPESRKAVVVGAGLAGVTAGLGLLQAGFDVTIYSDRTREALRDDVPPTGTAIYYGTSREYDAEIVEDLYDGTGDGVGMSVRLAAGDGEGASNPILEFDSPFGFVAQSVDVRLRADDRLGRFLERGGNFQVRAVGLDDIDAIASEADITLVATGKSGLSALFPRDDERSTFTAPARQLLLATFKGPGHTPEFFGHRSAGGARHYFFNVHPEFGEFVICAYLHKDIGPAWTFLAFSRPGSPWVEEAERVHDPVSARDFAVGLYQRYFPEDGAQAAALEPLTEDPHSWARGAVTPVVRRAVAVTPGGHVVAAIGDAAISVDPIGGQGAQNASIQVALLLRAVRAHDGAFDRAFFQEQFDAFWEHRAHAATEVTRLFLGDEKYAAHGELIFPAAAVSPAVGTAFLGLLSDPQRLLEVQTRQEVLDFITRHAGEPAEDVLARFTPATSFRSSDETLVPLA